MLYHERIISDHKILLGKPVILGTRISVEFLLKRLSEGASHSSLVEEYGLKHEDILAALEYASELMANQEELIVKK